MLRFAAELGMNIFWKSETDVRVFMVNNPDRIQNTPSERWGREIVNGMNLCPYDFIYLCDHYNLLPFFLSELERLKEINIGAGKTLFDHILEALRFAQEFLSSRKCRDNDMAFSLAMLFHHAGAISNQPLDEARAAEISESYLKGWNITSDVIETVCFIIKEYRSYYQPETEEKLAAEVMEHGMEVVGMAIDFAICNAKADNMKNVETLAANKWKLGEVARRYEEARRRADGNICYITGDEVMKILNIKPGKVIGEILGELEIAVGVGTVSSKKEATDWVAKRGA
jgi:tRNA nucleotidyltransferase/poly(A) polymerase